MIVRMDNMNDYYKSIFKEMDNYFFLNPDKIDLKKIFSVKKV